jgi:Protein of unknown function (DUF3379)
MMDHEQYRSAIMADPRDASPEAREHRESCPECRAFNESLQRFESKLERALKVEVPGKAGARAHRPWRRFAIAASLVLGVGLAGVLWLALPQSSLAADVVAHVQAEPEAWQHPDTAVAGPALDAVLKDSKLHLNSDAGPVSYASSCFFRNHFVPHLVVQTESGPVTVMVLVHESIGRTVQFSEQGYRGTIVPVPGHGAVAVLMRGAGADPQAVERIAARVGAAIDWAP